MIVAGYDPTNITPSVLAEAHRAATRLRAAACAIFAEISDLSDYEEQIDLLIGTAFWRRWPEGGRKQDGRAVRKLIGDPPVEALTRDQRQRVLTDLARLLAEWAYSPSLAWPAVRRALDDVMRLQGRARRRAA